MHMLRPGRYVWWCSGLIALICGAFWAFLLLRPFGPGAVVRGDNLFSVGGSAASFLLCAGSLRWARRRPAAGHAAPVGRPSWALLFIALAALCDLLANGMWGYYQLVAQQPPFPSWADAAYLSEYPLMLLGILALPRRSLAPVARTRVALDGILILTAAVTFSWYFVLGPTALQGGEELLAKAVSAAYPLGDLLLCACVLLLWWRDSEALVRPAMAILSTGLLLFVAADSAFDYQSLLGTYQTGAPFDPLWTLGFLLIGLSTQMLARTPASGYDADADRPPPVAALWRLLLPYACLPGVGALVAYVSRRHGPSALAAGVYGGGAMVLGLVLLRQVLALLENQRLYRQVAEANRRLQALATTDPLTELPNHRAMAAALDREVERAHRYGRPCALLFLDLDHFKALNDSWGHLAGDAALRALAALVRGELRSVDTLGRWGGEEFLALLPEADAVQALAAAERVRAAVAGHPFAVGGGLHLTCSVGVSIYPQDAQARAAWVDAADSAMYAAKRLGRNQVRAAGDPAVAALLATAADGSREETALVGTVEALAALVEARDRYTGEHTQEVATLATRLALSLGLGATEARMVGLAGRLHDVGKVGVPDAVLQKGGRLSEEEWATMRRHPAVGADVVSRVPALRALAPVIRGHHERWDGRGYPDGLAEVAIPMGARIVAVADAYGAMISGRPYQEARSHAWALGELRRCAGAQFDPVVVEACARVLGESRTPAAHRRAG